MIFRGVHLALKVLLFVLICALCSLPYYQYFLHLPRVQYLTGWLLLGVMLLLTLYNGRKKLPFLPLFSSRAWLQFHLWAGYLTLLFFGAHIRFQVPSGPLEWSLTLLYCGVMLSGVVGVFISRSFPKRLTTRGGEVFYESIPVVRRKLRERAAGLALQSVSDAKASTVADFYTAELSGFFSTPQNFWKHLFELRSPLNGLLKKIDDQKRFLNEKERTLLGEIAELIKVKDGLDYHHSLQSTLKLWLFVHIPLTYSLLILSIVHLIVVYSFSGGAG